MKRSKHSARSVARVVAKVLLGGTVLILIGRALHPHWAEIAKTASTVNPGYIAASAAAYFFYTFLNAGVWGQVLAALGHSMNAARSARIWVTTEALRWLPGGIWGYCSRLLEAQRHGIPKAVGSLSLTVEIALTVAAWCTAAATGALLSPLLGQLFTALPSHRLLPIGILLIAIAVVVPTTLRLFPNGYLSRLAKDKIRKLRTGGGVTLQHRNLLIAFFAYLALCLLQGISLLLIILALGLEAPPSLLLLTAVNAIAWLTGFFALGVPAGIGVREVTLVAGLAFSIPLEAAVCAAGLWRAIQIAVEPVCLGTCAIASSLRRRHSMATTPAAPPFANQTPNNNTKTS